MFKNNNHTYNSSTLYVGVTTLKSYDMAYDVSLDIE